MQFTTGSKEKVKTGCRLKIYLAARASFSARIIPQLDLKLALAAISDLLQKGLERESGRDVTSGGHSYSIILG
jgi:hypothetical protein